MKDTRCELVRRELEELPLNEDCGPTAAEHLRTCAGCQDFQRQQAKLRQIVGSLGTVNAPADFDFRLRARLAADAQTPSFRYWSFAVKGLATAAILVVFGVGVAVLRNREKPQPSVAAGPQIEPIKQQPTPGVSPAREPRQEVAVHNEPKRKLERSFVVKPKQSLTAVDFSKERAPVIGNTNAVMNNEPVFPIDASLQSLKVSLDDGRGNAHTVSFPTVSFGSQRVLTTANQLSPKIGVW
jgi:hypothetical protein